MRNAENKRGLLYSMLRIRRTQERIADNYLQDNMRTPIHLCIGQEAIAAGVCSVLSDSDVISSNHRGHGHYLAKGGNLKALIAELHGRATGCSKGFGGSMHIVDKAIGHLGSSAIVAGGIPVGTGHALAFAMRGEARVSAVFLGDGASEEGAFYESVNFAVLKKLPVVFIIEDNQYAVCSPVKNRQATRNVFFSGLPPEALWTASIDGNDVEAVRGAAQYALQRARAQAGPSLIGCSTYRMLGHAGCAEQDPQGYRQAEEINAWKKKCPVALYAARLLTDNTVTEEMIAEWEERIARELDAAFAYALSSPWPQPEELETWVYNQ